MSAAFAPDIPAASSPDNIPGVDCEARALSALRLQLWRGLLIDKLHRARLRLSLIVVLSACFWFGLYLLFLTGLNYLANIGEFKETIFNMYFSALMIMLFVSSGLILYSGVYRSEEVKFLLTLPISGRALFHHKLFEAVWFGGWGFLLTSTPMLVASGVQAGAPWFYYLLMPIFLAAFMYLPATLGALTCVLIVSWLPRRRKQVLYLAGAVLAALTLWIAWTALHLDQQALSPLWFKRISERLGFTQQRLLPSWWLSAGLLEAERNLSFDGKSSWSQSLMYLSVLVSNALVSHLVVVAIAGGRLRDSYQRLMAEYTNHQGTVSSGCSFAWRSLGRSGTAESLYLLLQKEWRIFTRDPAQWLQFVVFTSLLALYLVNLKRFPYEREQTVMIGFLNLAVVGLILSTFTTRFIYPMVSLEGNRFWILNLLPISRGQILFAKFLFAGIGAWLPCAGLILLSGYMLDLPLWMLLLHQLTIAELCLGLAGMAVGLGAIMADLREESPSKIAAGFGGTLNLVLSALFILIVVSLTAFPTQVSILQERGSWLFGQADWLNWFGTIEVIWIAQGINLLLSLAAGWGLLAAGIRSFQRLGQED